MKELVIGLAVVLAVACGVGVVYTQNNGDEAKVVENGAQTPVDLGVNINEQNNEGLTPLMIAIMNNQNELALDLLAKGADVNIKSKQGNTALLLATQEEISPDVIKALLDKGANVNEITVDDFSPLQLAAMFTPYSEVINMLIDAGADLERQNSVGKTPLILAIQINQNPEIAETFIERGADTASSMGDDEIAFIYAGVNPIYAENEELKQKLFDKIIATSSWRAAKQAKMLAEVKGEDISAETETEDMKTEPEEAAVIKEATPENDSEKAEDKADLEGVASDRKINEEVVNNVELIRIGIEGLESPKKGVEEVVKEETEAPKAEEKANESN